VHVTPPERTSTLIGETIGNYVVIAKLGQGGMGEVYLARHPRIGRQVALKILHAELSADKRVVERLFDEALATNLVKHPGIVEIFDCGFHQDRAYLIMERLEGESLGSRLGRAGRLAPGEARAIAAQMAAPLGAAHQHGIVHRDLKPDNVFLLKQGPPGVAVKILDFGIAKLTRLASPSHTDSKMLLGSPAYMSPEQCAGAKAVDARTDIYALGCILFEMVTRRRVFDYPGAGQHIAAHQTEEPIDPVALVPAVGRPLGDLILRMLAKRPQDRPQTMEDVARLLDGEGTLPALPPRASSGPGTWAAAPRLSEAEVPPPDPTRTTQRQTTHRERAGAAGGRRTLLWLALPALGASLAGGMFLWRGGIAPSTVDRTTLAPPNAADSRRPDGGTAATPTTQTPASPSIVPLPAPAPATAKAPPPVAVIAVTGLAPGTRAYVEGAEVRLPLELPRADGSVQVLFRAPGHHDASLLVDPEGPPEIDAGMTARQRPRRPSPAAKPSRKPAPASEDRRFRSFDDL
jgi:eukaryotic-like serine/threonine-protein kinase